ncbi:MAG: prepilin-type N-terminal cleavage/methylation domain-containing protein [Gemmatimonadaceae bacterium]|nr:prepilin-type N-terminal cleavage/methylation domain-containing protein [Gemmatimonadaceae bacterium]MCW5825933.1 prepilin-type N-terminal cleavage/methylation domain-containing protein [Gemmatimonadaceae bacterium]
MRQRRGFTLLEILMVMTLIGIVSGWMVARFTSARYRMDANVRLIQNVVIGAQQSAIARGIPVQLMFDASGESGHRIRVLLDSDDDGQVSVNETVSYRPLEGALFLAPDSTLDAATPAYVTGPGLVTGRPALQQAVRIGANGTLGGDVVIYIGTTVTRPQEMRAVVITGATARTAFWTRSSGSWTRREY